MLSNGVLVSCEQDCLVFLRLCWATELEHHLVQLESVVIGLNLEETVLVGLQKAKVKAYLIAELYLSLTKAPHQASTRLN